MLKSTCLYLGITACLLFMQTNALLPFGNHGVRPDLLLFVVLYASITLPPVQSACTVFMIGYLFEALCGAPAGLFISIYLLVFASISLLCRVFNFHTLIEMFGLLLACMAVKYLMVGFFMYFIYEYHATYMIQTVLREAFFTILFFPVLFPFIRTCINRLHTPLSSDAQ